MIFLFAPLVLFAIIFLFMKQEKFGEAPANERLERIQRSPNFKNGKFQNISFTPDLTEGVTYTKVLKEFIFERSKRLVPKVEIPSIKVDLKKLNLSKNLLIWFGHSSYFIQLGGKRILVDPVFSGSASPVNFTTKSFKGSDAYSVADIPEIDFLFITHDHWDHLDYRTVIKLKSKIKRVITGLGTGAHLQRWGYDPNCIEEKDWNEQLALTDEIQVQTTSARHFSGRGFKRNQALWMSFILEYNGLKIYLGGDSGYDTHFKTIGDLHGPFDLVLLECGQYHHNWKYIHMQPEELILAAKDLQAKHVMPVHWAKFALAQHDWDDPIARVKKEAAKHSLPLLHPRIGEEIDLDMLSTNYPEWWTGLN